MTTQLQWSKIRFWLKANCELFAFLLMVSVFSTTLSLSALLVLCNRTQNESSTTPNALFLARLHAALALVLRPNKPQLNLISTTLILWVCTRRPPLSLTWVVLRLVSNTSESGFFLNRHKNIDTVAEWKAFVCALPEMMNRWTKSWFYFKIREALSLRRNI